MPNSECSKVSQFMVRDVVKAEWWHPVSYARQQMLKHGFSYIPVWFENEWRMLSEYSVAKYLRGSPDKRNDRLVKTIKKAEAEKDGLKLPTVEKKYIVPPGKPISCILDRLDASPILVVAPKRENEPERKDELVGILTAADIL